MQFLKNALQCEQPIINEAIERHIAELPPLTQPVARHIFLAGGKRLRPLLTLWTGKLFGGGETLLLTIGASIEMLHAATLLHDDILDSADQRRGQPAAHTCFSQAHVILAGDALLAKALHMVSNLNNPRLTFCLSEAVLQTAEGQIAELSNTRNIHLPYADYLSIITGKTAWLLKTACEMGAIYAGAENAHINAVSTYGIEVGIAFQLVDDALDFAPTQETGKPRGGDLLEGKITPPLLFYLADLHENKKNAFIQKFLNSDFSKEELTQICQTIYTDGCCLKTRELAAEHIKKALDALVDLPDSPEKELLKMAAQYILIRSH